MSGRHLLRGRFGRRRIFLGAANEALASAFKVWRFLYGLEENRGAENRHKNHMDEKRNRKIPGGAELFYKLDDEVGFHKGGFYCNVTCLSDRMRAGLFGIDVWCRIA